MPSARATDDGHAIRRAHGLAPADIARWRSDRSAARSGRDPGAGQRKVRAAMVDLRGTLRPRRQARQRRLPHHRRAASTIPTVRPRPTGGIRRRPPLTSRRQGHATRRHCPHRVALKAQPDKPAPDVVAGSSYPFEMNVRWTDDLHGLASDDELRLLLGDARRRSDWNALAGIPDPTATGRPKLGRNGWCDPSAQPRPSQPTGSGKKVGRYESENRRRSGSADRPRHRLDVEDDRMAELGETMTADSRSPRRGSSTCSPGWREKDYNE